MCKTIDDVMKWKDGQRVVEDDRNGKATANGGKLVTTPRSHLSRPVHLASATRQRRTYSRVPTASQVCHRLQRPQQHPASAVDKPEPSYKLRVTTASSSSWPVLQRTMADEDHSSELAASGITMHSDSEQYSPGEELSTSAPSSGSPVILYKPPTLWSLLRGAAINLLLPFINGMMLGFGELFAHEAAFRFGWGGTKVRGLASQALLGSMGTGFILAIKLQGKLTPQ